jgi:hypothetical protein
VGKHLPHRFIDHGHQTSAMYSRALPTRALFLTLFSIATLVHGENELQHFGRKTEDKFGEVEAVIKKDAKKVEYESKKLERAAFRKPGGPWDQSFLGDLAEDEEKLVDKVRTSCRMLAIIGIADMPSLSSCRLI